MVSRTVSGVVLIAALTLGLTAGMTWSAFSGSASNTGNTFSAAASFTPELVKQLGTASCGGAASAVTVPAGGVAAGSTVVVTLLLRGTVTGTPAVSDSAGNSWSTDADITAAGSLRTVVFSSRIANALAPGDTISAAHPFSDNAQAISAAEFKGIAADARVDATATTTGNSSTPSATVTTTAPYGVLVGAVGNENLRTYTEAAGWGTLSELAANCGGGQRRATLHTGYRILTSPGTHTYDPTTTGNQAWAEAVVAYKG